MKRKKNHLSGKTQDRTIRILRGTLPVVSGMFHIRNISDPLALPDVTGPTFISSFTSDEGNEFSLQNCVYASNTSRQWTASNITGLFV
jgi:hypothetical protein